VDWGVVGGVGAAADVGVAVDGSCVVSAV